VQFGDTVFTYYAIFDFVGIKLSVVYIPIDINMSCNMDISRLCSAQRCSCFPFV